MSNDAAVFTPRPNKDLVFTKDTLVANIHFFANDDACLIAKKALRVNLSDLASMGAEPVGYLLSLSIPKENFNADEWVKSFVVGLKEDQEKYNWSLWGGDTVSTTGPLTISVTAIGQVDRGNTLTRSDAAVGDGVFVSGTLGDSAGGLKVLQKKLDSKKFKFLVTRYYLPEPRLELGQALLNIASTAMDISDGLMGDISHICSHSSVGAIINLAKIPISPSFSILLETNAEYNSLIC